MITKQQIWRLNRSMNKTGKIGISAAQSGMSEKTARKYLKLDKLPEQLKKEHNWATRKDEFESDWEEIKCMLESELEAKTLFEYLQRKKPGEYSDGQLRTLQRRIKVWRATEGPAKEVFFTQIHKPGKLSASDFTNMNSLKITINGIPFKHLIYHFVLTYSNWEAGTICLSESFENLSKGFQNALWKLGEIPERHRTDRLSSAVNKDCNPEEFTNNYKSLLSYYGVKGEKIQAGKANENGDSEQSHNILKRAIRQELLIRGSRNFKSYQEYEDFIQKMFNRLNKGRQSKLAEELKVIKVLPNKRLNDCSKERVKVSSGSTIQIKHNTYSVIGE